MEHEHFWGIAGMAFLAVLLLIAAFTDWRDDR
jgi:hypothetical protein